MSFCPDCEDSMLQPARSSTDVHKKVLKCMNCGYEQEIVTKAATKSTQAQDDKIRKAKTVIVDGESQGNPNLIVIAICPKCQHDQAATWQVQTRGGDEPSTHFYRCVKCNHTWREY